MKTQFVNYNGNLIEKGSPVFDGSNRSFCYGDGVFETIHANGTQLQFVYEHFERLKRSLSILQIDLPFDLDEFQGQAEKLLHKNRIYKGARVRFAVFRNSGGLYTPADNKASFLVEATPLDNETYQLNQTGLHIDFFTEIKKPINLLSSCKSSNALLFVMAGLHKKKNKLDDCILLNEKAGVCEAISSNIFFIKDREIYTPSLKSGCVQGIIREKLMDVARFYDYNIHEIEALSLKVIDHAEEILLTNAIQGIQWVGAYKENRYFALHARKFISGLNDIAFTYTK